MATETYNDDNITKLGSTKIYIISSSDARYFPNLKTWKWSSELPFNSYSIKETDLRRKTATITTPTRIDLTQARVFVKIVSPLHENFIGVILSKEYTRNTDGTHTYQCQDLSRLYQSKREFILNGKVTLYRFLKTLLSDNNVGVNANITDATKKSWANIWSGLRPLDYYKGSFLDNPIKLNMLAQKPKLVIRNKSVMDVILEVCAANSYTDIYWSSDGVLQIKPISLKEWQQTGLILTNHESLGSADFKFDTTNAISEVRITGEGKSGNQLGTNVTSKQLISLNLNAFFGSIGATTSDPANQNNTNKTSSSSKTSNKSTNKKKDNPYGTKKKYLLIDGDGGESLSFLKSIAEHIAKNTTGWKIDVDNNIGPGAHSRNKGKVKNGCYMPVYNGLCAGTINEMPASYYGGLIKKNGSVLCPAWDTHTWTSSKMKQYRTDISKIKYLNRAWDDNFSPSGFKGISNPSNFMNKNGIKYCVGDTAKKIAEQFLAGGWVAYNKK